MLNIATTKYIGRIAVSLLLILCAAQSMAAEQGSLQSPVGEWLVKDKTAHIRIVDCNKKLWGIISWVKEPDTDKNNPDISLRTRPVLGLPILLAMTPDDSGRWTGQIYNAQNGKTYESNISLKSADILNIQGCVLGILCGSEDWIRLEAAPVEKSSDSICQHM